MSDQKIIHIALITKNSEILLTDPLQEQAAYAIKDMCKEKGWGAVSITISTQVAQAEIAIPKDTQKGILLKEMKQAIAKRLFERDPELKARQKGQLWENNSVLTEDPAGLQEKIQQAIYWAYPGTHPGVQQP